MNELPERRRVIVVGAGLTFSCACEPQQSTVPREYAAETLRTPSSVREIGIVTVALPSITGTRTVSTHGPPMFTVPPEIDAPLAM